MRSKVLMAVLAILVAAAAQSAVAQTAYPNRSITVIVPFAAGGPTDVVARLVGEHMTRTLGQQLVIENVGGSQRRLAGVELGEANLGVGVDHRLLIDQPDALQRADPAFAGTGSERVPR